MGKAQDAEGRRTLDTGSGGGVRGFAGQCGQQKDVRGSEAPGTTVKCEYYYYIIILNVLRLKIE